jgi:predicted dehydrogenase
VLNAAIVGLGRWGQKIVNAVQGKSEYMRFVHGVSKEPDSVREFAEQHRLRLSTDLSDVLGDPQVQAVVLVTPHSLHVDQISAVAKAGKPVFCEKPLALRKAEAVRAVRACEEAGVLLGIGTNKRLWPCMRELRAVLASGALGEILHFEAHYSNENAESNTTSWRSLPSEAPAGGMTGSGIHVLDALVSLAGPARRVHAQLVVRKRHPAPHDTMSVMFEFANGKSGFLGAVRSTPFYWRAHVFGTKGSAEALGETDLVVRLGQGKIERQSFAPVDSLRAEFDVFAQAVMGRSSYPIKTAEMINTVAAFEAIVQSLESNATITLGD